MPFVANFPFFCILITMFGGILTSMVSGKWAFRINTVVCNTQISANVHMSRFCHIKFSMELHL